ncbi:hypothetical protein D3C76_165740 [compost metagenome]
MTFNQIMICMLLGALVLCMCGFARNISPACKDKTRWGWFVIGLPMGLIPFSVALYRTLINP